MGIQLFVLLLTAALVIGGALVLLGRRRPERVTLVLAIFVVVVGLTATGVEVVAGIADREIAFRGSLDAGEIRDAFSPPAERDPQATRGYGYLSGAEGETTRPQAGTRVLVLWSIAQLAPWLLAAIVLVLVHPILRAAGRGDPFWSGATRRLSAVGVLLLLGIPSIAIVQFLTAEAASSGTFLSPVVEPELTISIAQLLPGFLVLALVGIFRRGGELRDLERHTI